MNDDFDAGILGQVPGAAIAKGSNTLPPASLGSAPAVHGRSSHWAWVAVSTQRLAESQTSGNSPVSGSAAASRAGRFLLREDDGIHEDSTVRVIDVFVDELDLKKLGFDRAEPALTGLPAHRPATLLKIYIDGYLSRVQAGRRLEAEALKTIGDFRRGNGEAIRKVCKEFVLLCRRMKPFTGGIVAIDGSKFKAVNNHDKNFTDRKLAADIEQLEDSIKRYLVELDRADCDAAAVLRGRVDHLTDKIAEVKQQIQALNEIGEQMKGAADGQTSLTDPDARSMATRGRGTGTVGYNVQTPVDAKHHLIVAHGVSNVGHDRDQLAYMAKLARGATAQDDLIALADRSHDEGYEILECELAGVAAVVSKPMPSNNAAAGLFDKRDFVRATRPTSSDVRQAALPSTA